MSGPGDETGERAPEPAPSTSPAPAADAAAGRLNALAVLSLVLGAGYFVIGISIGLTGRSAPDVLLVMPAGAVVAGYVARTQIWRNRQRGGVLASAGIAFGYVGLALLLFGLALALLAAH